MTKHHDGALLIVEKNEAPKDEKEFSVMLWELDNFLGNRGFKLDGFYRTESMVKHYGRIYLERIKDAAEAELQKYLERIKINH